MADWGFVVIMSIVPRRRRRTVPGLLVLVVISLTPACGGDDDDGTAPDPTPRSTTTTTEPTTTTLSELDQKIEAAKAAYLAFMHAVRAAEAAPVTPHLPDVQAVMTGLQQTQITANLEGMQARGEAVRLPENSQDSQEVLTASLQPDGSVLLKACEINDAVVYDVATGAVVDDDVITIEVDVTVVQENGVWKVADTVITEESNGVVPCGA
ncbi:MAG TPA: hypothetical protein VFB94_08320 [Acidimicrobiales bacterium]|nr:hypothetical protein [Acidimicrobiales bacterium]